MLKILIVLQALCSAPQAEAPVCKVRWATFDGGYQSVLIAGHHETDVVICKVIDVARADCRVFDESYITTDKLAAK